MNKLLCVCFVLRKALFCHRSATKSPWDSNGRLLSPQAELPSFAGSPCEHLTLLIYGHRMGATARHRRNSLSVQSHHQLCGEKREAHQTTTSIQSLDKTTQKKRMYSFEKLASLVKKVKNQNKHVRKNDRS